MNNWVTIALALAVVALLVFLVVQSRRRPAEGIDEHRLRQLLDQALDGQGRTRTEPQTGGKHAEPLGLIATPTVDQASAAELAAARAELGAADAAVKQAEQARITAEKRAAELQRDLDAAGAAQDRRREEHQRELEDRIAKVRADATAELESDRAELQRLRNRVDADRADLEEAQQRIGRERERLATDDRDLQQSLTTLGEKQTQLRSQQHELARAVADLDQRQAEIERRASEVDAELARLAGLTVEEARAELLARQESVVRRDAALLARRIELDAERDAKIKARAIVADAIQKVASAHTAQTVVSMVPLPADDVKGRIIGREGRNIRAFETVTGVNVIIDDTPEAVLLSCFDPVRREIGRITLEALIEDGRIHPQRIEEEYERAQEEVSVRCDRAADDALLEVGITDLHPELRKLLGQLNYRVSYGQNVLGHLVESAHIARTMAAELGIEPTIAMRGAFLHDIGKALTHESLGTHALVGADLARRYGESEEVAHCIEAHHDEVPPSTVEAVLTQAADACSGGRPGARRESLESYVQRLERIEQIASSRQGVEKAFAMQAGRELRVMVKPDVIDDFEATILAREVAKQIEEELTYPGQVRVTVIRESRATEVAR